MTRCEAVSVYRTFEALPAPARRALGEHESGDLHDSLDWFELLAATALETGDRARIHLIEPAPDQPPLCLPCRSGNHWAGNRLSALANFYTPLFGPVRGCGITARHLGSWVRFLDRERPRWAVVDLRPLDPASAFFEQLMAAFRRAGWWADRYFCFGNWYLEVEGRSFDEYFEERPGPLRNTIARARRRLERRDDVRLEIVTAPGPSLARAIEDFQAVYARSWKKPEPFPRFIPSLCKLAAHRGWLRLGILRLDGQPIAAQIWLCDGRTASIVKLAHDRAMDRLSAGSVLTAALMQQVIDRDRVRIVDYLIGDDPYKRDWMSHRRERHGFIAFNPRTVRGLAEATRHFGARLLRRLGRVGTLVTQGANTGESG